MASTLVQDSTTTTDAATDAGYIKTTTHNFISRQAKVQGAQQVELKGRSIVQSGVIIRGDLAIVRIGRYCEIDINTTLEPPSHPNNNNNNTSAVPRYIPMIVGSYTHIGTNCNIRAAAIGSMVWIGDNVTLGERTIIKDNCWIEAGVTLAADTVIPPFTRITLSNSNNNNNNSTTILPIHMELPPSMAVHMQESASDRYQAFKQMERQT